MRPAFLALGDSYTIGEGVAPDGRWPAQLATRLRLRGTDVAEPAIIARTGWTTDELDAGIDASGPTGTFDLVTLLIGVNDAYRGRDAAAYARVLPGLVARAVALAGGRAHHVLLVSIPDWSVTPFAAGRDRAAIAATIDAYNDVARAAAVRAGAQWADVTPASRREEPRWLADDGLHPSERQYAAWVDVIAPLAHGMLVAR